MGKMKHGKFVKQRVLMNEVKMIEVTHIGLNQESAGEYGLLQV